jgi:FkbM family methyltransferase
MKKILSQILTHLPYGVTNNILDLIQEKFVENWDERLLGLRELPIKSVIDIGANKGQSSQKFPSIFPSAKIYAFEPTEVAYQKLSKLAQKNPSIIPYNLALGDEEKEVEFYQHLYYSQSSSILKNTNFHEANNPITKDQKLVKIQQLTLDQVILSLPIPLEQDILIKIDVQGYEDRVIKGGIEVLKKAKVCISEISADIYYEDQASFEKIFDLLKPLGYSYFGNLDQVVAKTGKLQYIDAIWIKRDVV